MPRARPKVSNEIVKSFGSNVAPRPLNPSQNQEQTYSPITEITGCEVPRYIYITAVVFSFSLSLSLFLSALIERSKCILEEHRNVQMLHTQGLLYL